MSSTSTLNSVNTFVGSIGMAAGLANPAVGAAMLVGTGFCSFLTSFISDPDGISQAIKSMSDSFNQDLKQVGDTVTNSFLTQNLAQVNVAQSTITGIFASWDPALGQYQLSWNAYAGITNTGAATVGTAIIKDAAARTRHTTLPAVPVKTTGDTPSPLPAPVPDESGVRAQFTSASGIFGVSSPLKQALDAAMLHDTSDCPDHRYLCLALNAVSTLIMSATLMAVLDNAWYNAVWVKNGEIGDPPDTAQIYKQADVKSQMSTLLTTYLGWLTTVVTNINADRIARENAAIAAANAAGPAASTFTGSSMCSNGDTAWVYTMLAVAQARSAAYINGTTTNLQHLTSKTEIYAMNKVYNGLVDAQTGYMTVTLGQTDWKPLAKFPVA